MGVTERFRDVKGFCTRTLRKCRDTKFSVYVGAPSGDAKFEGEEGIVPSKGDPHLTLTYGEVTSTKSSVETFVS